MSTIHTDGRPDESSAPSQDVLYAAGIGLRADDATLPCLTIRMWVLGVGFCLLGSGVNTLYTFRLPSITLSQSAIQFLAYPVGKAWEYVVPDWGLSINGHRYSLNPGPFNYKVRLHYFQEYSPIKTSQLIVIHRRTYSSTSWPTSASSPGSAPTS